MKMIRDASLSINGRYRWSLSRDWGGMADPWVGWIMLNPSTADAAIDDPTIRRCIAFSKAWGFGGLTVRNLFNLRSTSPDALAADADPVGPQPHCDKLIVDMADVCPVIVAAWGAEPFASKRAAEVVALCKRHNITLSCLGMTKDGSPRHPLYVKGDTRIVPFGDVTATHGGPVG